MKGFDIQKISKWLAQVLRCPVCGFRYNMEHTKIIDSKENLAAVSNILIHTDCEQCSSSVIFSIAIEGPEIFSVGMVTDLTSKDTDKFRDSNPVNTEDIISLHEFLENCNGDFKQIF
jgi:hypothetical protein